MDAASRRAAFEIDDASTWTPAQRERHWNPFLRHSELSASEQALAIPDRMADILAEAEPAEDFNALPEPVELPPDALPPISDELFVRGMPGEYQMRLEKLPEHQRRERLMAIRARISDQDLWLLMTHPIALTAMARARADAATREQEERREDEQRRRHDHGPTAIPTPSELRQRTSGFWLSQWTKRCREVDLDLAAATGAVGRTIGAPYASAFTLSRYVQGQEQAKEIMRGLRLVRRDKPTVQLDAAEVAERAANARQAKLRLLLDAEEHRGRELGLTLTWITITLPGSYVPRAMDEDERASTWNPDHGFLAGDKFVQKRWTQIRALAAKEEIELSGPWASQLQANGVQHRHMAIWCESVKAARKFCDIVRAKFPGKHGCRAYVVGDTNRRYRPRKRKDTKTTETVGSVFRYLARYALREAFMIDGDDKRTRHAAGIAGRVRGFAFLGLSPGAGQTWDALWAGMEREEFDHSDPRIATAMAHLVEAQAWSRAAADARSRDDASALRLAQDAASRSAYLACLAMGRWKKKADSESKWLEKRFGSGRAPDRVFKDRRTKFGDLRRDFVGVRSGSDVNGEVVNLHAHEWNLVDVDTAREMAEDFGGVVLQPRSKARREPLVAGATPGEASLGVTVSLTCPRVAPAGLPTVPLQEVDRPPGAPPPSMQAA